MAADTAEKFIDALHKLEAERDLDTIASLFADDADVANVITEDNDKTTVLEIDGDVITRFRAYFDPNKLGKQIVEEKSQGA